MEILVFSDQVIADEAQMGAIGAVVVSEEAQAIGVTAIPTPVTSDGSDLFFMHQPFLNQFTFVSGVGFEGNSGQRFTIDSKAMRKVEDGQDLAIVAELDASGTGFILGTIGRMLIKVH